MKKLDNLDPNTLTQADISMVIEMALCDWTSFDQIEAQTGLSESQVIKIMQQNIKPRSFKVWRERAGGRKQKHGAKNTP